MHSLAWLRRTGMLLLIVFVLLTASLLVVGLTVPKVKNFEVYRTHPTILIGGRNDFTALNGVTGGNGTKSDPYLIEGWSIASRQVPAIAISNTNASVRIRNVSIVGGGNEPLNDGIVLSHACNVTMDGVTVDGFRTGISVNSSQTSPSIDIEVLNCTITSCTNGVWVRNATGLEINHCMVDNMWQSGLVVENCSSVQVLDNEIENFGLMSRSYWSYTPLRLPSAGLSLAYTNDVHVAANSFSGGTYDFEGIEARKCSNVSANQNSFDLSQEISARFDQCINVAVQNNTLREEILFSNSTRMALTSSLIFSSRS